MNLTRRSFILQSAASVSALAFSRFTAASPKSPVPMAIQLYSVRDAAEKDLPGTLQALSKIGYQGVEFAGTYGHSAEDVKQMLDDFHLVCVGTHLGLGDLLGDRFEETAKYYSLLGNRNLIVAGGLGEALMTDGGNQCAAYLFSELAKKAAQAGFRIGYHAHAGDFADMGNGETAWDLFFSRTAPEVIAEMDVGNCLDCGADPYRSMEKAPGRGILIHLKASKSDGTLLGSEGDETDLPRVFRICESVAGTEWYIVEQEGNTEMPSLDAAARCYENVKRIRNIS